LTLLRKEGNLLGVDDKTAHQDPDAPAKSKEEREETSKFFIQVAGSLGAISILLLPGFITINKGPGSEIFYSATAQALPALLIGVVLAYRLVVGEFRKAFPRLPNSRFRRTALWVYLAVWAMLIASGTTFTALTECTGETCGTASELDRVYLGLAAGYLLVARLAIAGFNAVLNEVDKRNDN
jgi:hypothetical protein